MALRVLSALDNSFPRFTTETAEQKIDTILDYLYQQNEVIRYLMSHIGTDNMDLTDVDAHIKEVAPESISVNQVISNAVVTETLYAERGDIVELTVDRLETANKIKRYLSSDTSTMLFIRIYEQYLQFINATVTTDDSGTAQTEQLTDRNGNLLYWEQDISEATITGGYPYIDGKQVYTTKDNTGFPVTVYAYDEAYSRTIAFAYDEDTGYYLPIDTFGAGNGSGGSAEEGKAYNQGIVQKTGNKFSLLYRIGTGDEIGAVMNSSGYMDLYGLRKTTKMDFGDWDDGSFAETVDEGATSTYTVSFDDEGRPITITDDAGHECVVAWD